MWSIRWSLGCFRQKRRYRRRPGPPSDPLIDCWRHQWVALLLHRPLSTCLWAPTCRTCQTAGSGCRSPAAAARRPWSAGGRGTSLYPWLREDRNTAAQLQDSCSTAGSPPDGGRKLQLHYIILIQHRSINIYVPEQNLFSFLFWNMWKSRFKKQSQVLSIFLFWF